MMKAEVTAENKPACDPNEHMCALKSPVTHKYQRRVQVFVVFLEFPIVIVGFPPVMVIELGAQIVPTRP